MSENQACCAHSKVVLRHNDYPDGSRSDYWECDSGCGARFLPENTNQGDRRLRDAFAIAALQGSLDSYRKNGGEKSILELAESCYAYADALLKARTQ